MDELLQRLRRLSAATAASSTAGSEGDVDRPPNAASAALGRHVAQAWMDDHYVRSTKSNSKSRLEDDNNNMILNALITTRKLNPAFPHEFFATILSFYLQKLQKLNDDDDENTSNNLLDSNDASLLLLEWLPSWVVRLDEVAFESGKSVDGGVLESLWASIRTLVLASFHALSLDSNGNNLATTYRRLRVGRSCLLRHVAQAACQLPTNNDSRTSLSYQVAADRVIRVLSPIMASCVLSFSTPFSEKTTLLECLWREMRLLQQHQQQQQQPPHHQDTQLFVPSLLEWLTHVLLIYLWRLPLEPTLPSDPFGSSVSKELAFRWLEEIVDQTVTTSATHGQATASTVYLLQYQVIPLLTAHLPHHRMSVAPMLTQLTIMMQRQQQEETMGSTHFVLLDRAVSLRLGAVTLANPMSDDVVAALNLLSSQTMADFQCHDIVRTLTAAFLPNASCHDAASRLYQHQQQQQQQANLSEQKPNEIPVVLSTRKWVQLSAFDHQTLAGDELLGLMAQANPSKWRISAVQQSAALLVGAAMWQGRRSHESSTFILYLKRLLTAYPHLCISFLPIVMDLLRRATVEDATGDDVLYLLEVLCDTVVVDPTCAQEVWSLLSRPDAPLVFRSTILRLYPRLCGTNRRLTRRVMDSLGPFVQSTTDLELRVAVAATLADLAKEDLLRDITDVVAWVQTFLTDENVVVVHFAILTLHHLVIAQELDFDLVIKVLNKRLCSIGNAEELLALSDVVLESLVLLLGDGECGTGSDSEEDEGDNEPTVATVSPQVSRAVQSLLLILQSPKIRAVSTDETVNSSFPVVESVRLNAFEALGKYSLLALGVEEEGIRALVARNQEADTEVSNSLKEAGLKYSQLKDLVFQGIFTLQSDDPTANPALNLAVRLVGFEEEVLGTTLWHTRGKRQPKTASGRKGEPSKTALAALPLESTVQELYHQNPSSATAIASLLCFTGHDLSALLSLACEMSNESVDPLFRVFTLQAWLHVTAQLLSPVFASNTETSTLERLEQIVKEIRNWTNVMDQPDGMYLALACLAFQIPETWSVADKTVTFAAVVSDILNEITDSVCKGHRMENHDIAMMCLGIAGARYLQSRWMDRVDVIMDTLLSSTKTRRSNFGAYYGLSVIAQGCSSAVKAASSGNHSHEQADELNRRTGRVLAFLVEELASVVEGETKAFTTFAACLQSGKTTRGLLTFPERGLRSLQPSQQLKAKSLFIALGLSAPTLLSLNTELLLGMHQMLQSLRRCNGRCFASAPTFLACKLASVLSQEEVELLHKEHVQVIEAELSGDSEQLADGLYEIAVTKTEPFPTSLTVVLLQETSPTSIVVVRLSTVLSLGSIPALGAGATSLLHHARLNFDTKKADITRVSDLLRTSAQDGSGGQLEDFSSMLLGMMSSWKIQPGIVSSKNVSIATSEATVSTKLRFSELPTALPGSMLDSVLFHIQSCYETAFSVDKSSSRENQLTKMSYSLRCLESLSLPDQFATLFLDPLIHSKTDEDLFKTACISLLLSQVSGRRRAAFDGREFLNLVLRLSSESYPSFRTIMKSDASAELLLQAAAEIIPKAPTDAAEAALTNILSLCIEHMKETNNSWILTWLSSLQNLLQSASGEKAKLKMSPRTINFLRRYTIQQVFNALSTRTLEPHCETVIQSYVSCLQQISLLVLEEANVFSIKKYSEDFAKQCFVVHCIAVLIQREFIVEQASRELSKIVAWYILQQQTTSLSYSATTTMLQRLACSVAEASQVVKKPECKRDLLLFLLEGLLESKTPRVGLELLSMLVARWQCPSSESDLSLTFVVCADQMDVVRTLAAPTLAVMVQVLVHNLPFHLASFCRQERLTDVVSNRLWRIYSFLQEAQLLDGDPTTLDCVRRALICCSDIHSGEEQFVTAVTSLLVEND